ncbi:MAG TPA: carboxymuconolactone decarboxylase family protein [Puia sp.]|nr:carboxymuconolactone decarboxylase family protein [Puia sp.]
MEQRLNMEKVFPEAYKGMYALSACIGKTELTALQKELIKIRVSQINRCAFCLNMHTRDALKLGETSQRIFLLNAWKESALFTEEEKTLLALTEEVTLINEQGVTDSTYRKALQYFTEIQVAQIIMNIVLINGWNRIAVSTHLPIQD